MPNAPYDFAAIEKKWQKIWDEEKTFAASDDFSKPKYYAIEFPYPSGAGLHVGHPRSNTAMDIIGRKKRLQGYNVLFPIGMRRLSAGPWRTYAIKNHIHPAKVTHENTSRSLP